MFFSRATVLLSLVAALSISDAVKAGGGVVTKCVKSNHVALTFDDGPFKFTNEAIKILDDNGAKGTFFVNGLNWGCIYDQASVDTLKHAYWGRHQIASHTWAHKDLTTLSGKELDQEFRKAHLAIQRITGASVAFMRPPYGKWNDTVVAAARKLGETPVLWDFDSGDSVGVSAADQKQRYTDFVARKPRPSNLLSLQHDVHESSIKEVLPHAVRTLKNAGYKLVTVAECLGQPAYQWTQRPQSRNKDWHC